MYTAQVLTGIFQAFQTPAYKVAITLLIPKTQYTRANALWALADSMGEVLAPLSAGLLLYGIGISGIMLMDIITFVLAAIALIVVRIPKPVQENDNPPKKRSAMQALSYGFRYIGRRPGLRGLLLIFMGINFFAAMTYLSRLPALILTRTGGAELTLASVQTALGVGGVVGSMLLLIWGGPRRLIHGVLAGAGASFILGDFLFAVGRSLPVWIAAAFCAAVFVPMVLGSYRSIWQRKVAPNAQGRVFSVQGMLQQISLPVGYLLAGPLADRVFEPAMTSGGNLPYVFGWLVGTGPGAGMGVTFMCTGVSGLLVSLSGYMIPAIRNIEKDLPDFDGDEGF